MYGPLTGVIALLLWAQLTSIAIFLGLALAAQLEAVRAGVPSGAADPDPPAANTAPAPDVQRESGDLTTHCSTPPAQD